MSLRKLANLLTLLTGSFVFIFFCVFYLIYVYPKYPEYFGNYSFYTNCKELRQGMTVADARERMRSYVEATQLNLPSLFAAKFDNNETSDEYKNRLIFVPDKRKVADWCIVYTNGKNVLRVAISPD